MPTRHLIFFALWLLCLSLSTACNMSAAVRNLPNPPRLPDSNVPHIPASGLGSAAREAADRLMDLIEEADLLEATAQVAVGVPWVTTEVHCQALRYEESNGLRPTSDQYRTWLGEALGAVIDPVLEGESRKALYEQLNALQARVMALRASDHATFVEYYTQTCS